MSQQKPRRTDQLAANTLSALGSVGQHYPWIERRVVGSTRLNYVQVHWFTTGQHANEVSRWVPFEPGTSRSNFPAKFNEVGILSADIHTIDSSVSRQGAQQAVAYVVRKSAVMVGVAAEHIAEGVPGQQLFDKVGEIFSEQRYRVGLRLGPGAVQAAMGVYQHGEFLALMDNSSAGPTLPLFSYNGRFA